MARVHIAIREKSKEYYGLGTHTDTIMAASLAYIDAVNKFI